MLGGTTTPSLPSPRSIWENELTKTHVLFIQGGGKGAHHEDAPLASSLKRALGSEYEVHFPLMPHEADPNVGAWKEKISVELSHLPGAVVIVAHSIGGSILLRYLTEEKAQATVASAFLLAAPSWDGDRWSFDDLKLPTDAAERLAFIPRLVFYHCRDDGNVPSAHLELHGRIFPRATTQLLPSGGHQFGNDLAGVAADIRRSSAADVAA